MIEKLEQELDSFNPEQRKNALSALCEKVNSGQILLPNPGTSVNLHCHTFFSYNTYGYSPSKFAWLARKAGLDQDVWRTPAASLSVFEAQVIAESSAERLEARRREGAEQRGFPRGHL